MENDRITEYAKKNREADRVGLVSRFISSATISFEYLNIEFCSYGM